MKETLIHWLAYLSYGFILLILFAIALIILIAMLQLIARVAIYLYIKNLKRKAGKDEVAITIIETYLKKVML